MCLNLIYEYLINVHVGNRYIPGIYLKSQIMNYQRYLVVSTCDSLCHVHFIE